MHIKCCKLSWYFGPDSTDDLGSSSVRPQMSFQPFSVSIVYFRSESGCTYLAEWRKLVTFWEHEWSQLSICIWRTVASRFPGWWQHVPDSEVRKRSASFRELFQEMMKTVSGSQFDLVVFSFQPVEEPFCKDECSCLLPLCPPSILRLDYSVLHTDKNTREQTRQQNTVHQTERGGWKD